MRRPSSLGKQDIRGFISPDLDPIITLIELVLSVIFFKRRSTDADESAVRFTIPDSLLIVPRHLVAHDPDIFVNLVNDAVDGGFGE